MVYRVLPVNKITQERRQKEANNKEEYLLPTVIWLHRNHLQF